MDDEAKFVVTVETVPTTVVIKRADGRVETYPPQGAGGPEQLAGNTTDAECDGKVSTDGRSTV